MRIDGDLRISCEKQVDESYIIMVGEDKYYSSMNYARQTLTLTSRLDGALSYGTNIKDMMIDCKRIAELGHKDIKIIRLKEIVTVSVYECEMEACVNHDGHYLMVKNAGESDE